MVTPRIRAVMKICLGVVLLLMPGFVLWRTGVLARLTPEAVLPHLLTLDGWATGHSVLAWVLFVAMGGVLIASSAPGVALTVMTAAGFVFGPVIGAVLGLSALILGSCAAFVLARCFSRVIAGTALGPTLAAVALRLNTGRITPLIVARIAPGAPFWIVNLALGVMRLDPVRFAWTSAIGFLPGAIVFALMGDGLGDQLRTTGHMDAHILTSPQVWGPFLVLTVVVLAMNAVVKQRDRG